jgi:hypothetical protein
MQGNVGDCGMISGLAATAYSRPDMIEKNIWVDSSGFANVRVDNITGWGKDVIYRVDTGLSNSFAKVRSDNWVALYEKGNLAAAIDKNYSISGGAARTGYSILEFCAPVVYTLDGEKPQNSIVSEAGARVSEGFSGTLGYGAHAYAALDYDKTTNKYYLYNPYGVSTDYVPSNAANSGFIFVGRTESYTQTLGNGRKLTTTSGKDVITGTALNDNINALADDDYITGGAGYDTFDLRSYNKSGNGDYAVIQDFWSAKDKIVLSQNETYYLGAVSTFENQASRALFNSNNDLIAHIQGINEDLSNLSLTSGRISYI